MKMHPKSDTLVQELAAMRELIAGHENVKQLLDLAAEEADRRALANEHSRRLAWRVAAGMGVGMIVGLGIAYGAVQTMLRPPAEPQVLVVSKGDGIAQPLISLTEFQQSPEEATIRRNITTIVEHCEGYSYDLADDYYYTCAAFMSPQLQAQWARKWDKANPDSPPNKYKKQGKVRAKVGAITILRNNLGFAIGARASFTRTELLNDVDNGPPTNWIATIPFHWVNQPTIERDRRINDLGMEMTDYSSDRDLAAPGPTPSAAPVRQTARPSSGSPMALAAPANVQKVTP